MRASARRGGSGFARGCVRRVGIFTFVVCQAAALGALHVRLLGWRPGRGLAHRIGEASRRDKGARRIDITLIGRVVTFALDRFGYRAQTNHRPASAWTGLMGELSAWTSEHHRKQAYAAEVVGSLQARACDDGKKKAAKLAMHALVKIPSPIRKPVKLATG